MLNGELMSTIIQLAAIFFIFYFILIRPQQNKIKDHNKMLEEIKVGDKVVTGGGIYATVRKAEVVDLTVEIAQGLEVVVKRSTIRDVLEEETTSGKVKKNPEKKSTVKKVSEKKASTKKTK